MYKNPLSYNFPLDTFVPANGKELHIPEAKPYNQFGNQNNDLHVPVSDIPTDRISKFFSDLNSKQHSGSSMVYKVRRDGNTYNISRSDGSENDKMSKYLSELQKRNDADNAERTRKQMDELIKNGILIPSRLEEEI